MAGKTDAVSIRVPYRKMKDAELEMVDMEDMHHQIDLNSASSSPHKAPNGTAASAAQNQIKSKQCSLVTLVLSCTIAAGVQFGWALQLSLLTPYIQVVIVNLDLN